MRVLRTASTRRYATFLALAPLLGLAGACEKQGDQPEPDNGSTPTDTFTLPEVDVSGWPAGLQEQVGVLRQAIEEAPGNPEQLGRLGSIFFVHGTPQAAVACFEQAKESAPEEVHWWYYLGVACSQTQERDKAIGAFERVLELRASFGPAYVKLAGVLLGSDSQRAARLCRRALELNPKDPTAILGLGLCAGAAGEHTKALARIEEALRIVPDYQEAHLAMARLLTDMGREQEAEVHRAAAARGRTPLINDPLFEMLLRYGLHLETLLHDALLLAERGAFAQADNALAKARQVDKTGLPTREATGMVRVMQGRFAEAADEFRLVLQAQPDVPDVKAKLADAQARLGNHEEAEAGFRAVLEQNPDHQFVLERYSELLLALKRAEEAETLLSQAAERQPSNPSLLLRLAVVLLELNKDDQARQRLQACLAAVPDDPRARYYLGLLARRADDLAGARQEWERIVVTTPGFVDAYVALAETALQERDFAAAEQHMRAGLRQAPDLPGLTNGLAWILATSPDENQRRGQEAVELAEKACERTQNRQHGYLDTLAAAYAEVGRFDEALTTAAEALRLAEEAGNEEAAAAYRQRLALYEKQEPYHETE